jgi:hypothetical protein
MYMLLACLFLSVSGELAITSSRRVLELLLPRHVSRVDEEIKGYNVSRVPSLETFPNKKKAFPQYVPCGGHGGLG